MKFDDDSFCTSCNNQGFLEVCVGMSPNGVNDLWQTKWCEDCWVIIPNCDPPKIKD